MIRALITAGYALGAFLVCLTAALLMGVMWSPAVGAVTFWALAAAFALDVVGRRADR